MKRNYEVKTFILKPFPFKGAMNSQSCGIIKIAILLIKTTYKNSIKFKRIRKNVSRYNFCLYFQINKNF